MEEKVNLEVGGRKLQVSHIDKVFFAAKRFTKAHVIDYYIRMAPFILPHLKDRPLTLKLYLNGITAKPEYIKDAPSFTPAWVKRTSVSRKGGGPPIHYVLINDLPSLVWAANLNNIEMHTFLAKARAIGRPLLMVFDLDPGTPATILDCARVALVLKEALDALKLQSFVKSSGSKGLHLCVPLNTRVSYEQTQSLAEALAAWLERAHPKLVVTEMSKALRSGKVFVDYSQNVSFKSTACVYSLRARADGPFVSMPISWQELTEAFEAGDAARFFVEPRQAIEQCEHSGDLFAEVLTLKQRLPADIDSLLARLPAVDGTRTLIRSNQRTGPTGAWTLVRRTSRRKSAGTSPATQSDSRTSSLQRYRQKRDFNRTREPAGLPRSRRIKARAPAPDQPTDKPRMFVIQKHAASHLHYDFRLEMQGVLRSWAVPKGPPYQRGERRLAMLVEDHPIEYARFEGTIPKGEYGGGTVMVWDIGTYEVRDTSAPQAFHSGKMHMFLKGKKLKGEWTLVRARTDERGRESWFLIKTGDSTPPLSPRRDDQSALTRRSMKRIAEQNTAQWSSNRTQG